MKLHNWISPVIWPSCLYFYIRLFYMALFLGAYFFENVSFSISYQKITGLSDFGTLKLRDSAIFAFIFLAYSFITNFDKNFYEGAIFPQLNYDLRGHKRSHMVILKFQNIFLCDIFFVYLLIFLKLFKNVNIMNMQIFHKMKYQLKGHPRSCKTNFMPKSF